MTSAAHRFDVDCYIRPTAATGAVDEIVSTLRRYDHRDRFGSLSFGTWPTSVGLDTPAFREVRATVRTFRAWATERDVALDPMFAVEEHVTEITGERAKRLRLPVVCLAIYEDGKLECVLPHRSAGRIWTVPDALDAMEAEGVAALATLAGPTDPEPSIPS